MGQGKRAWIYCAIDAPEDRNGALKSQFKQLIDYGEQMGFELVGSSSDVGATPLWNRNGFRHFIEAVQKEQIMDTETMGYAYEYPYGGGARKEYMLALTPENLANFIGARGYDAKKIVITDVLDRLIVNTCMGMLDVCPDQKLCGRIIEYLAPIQLGEKEAGEILAVERNVADEYFAMEDEAVTMAECQML